jgi:general secretion pathway protein E
MSELEERLLGSLLEKAAVTPVIADRVMRIRAETGDRLASVLLKLGLVSEDEVADHMAKLGGLARFQLSDLPPLPSELQDINPSLLKGYGVVPLRVSENTLYVACWDATEDYIPKALGFATGLLVSRVIGTRSEIERAAQSLYPSERALETIEVAPDEVGEQDELLRLKDLASDAPIIRLVQRIIDEAVSARASDIHFETSEDALVVRFRLDGMLRESVRHPKAYAAPVVSRVKVMAGLNIAERRLPQDGRIRVNVQGKEIDFRVATSPTLHGESMVLRILDKQDVQLDFQSLGFPEAIQSAIAEAVGRPHGIVLVTGPTGSGKTTTLYAALSLINQPHRKILTVEDPVEYVLAGVNQVPIRPQVGLTFAQALRAFLRQDPDVLMVGEIRDRETAETAVQAALTGHLLLSTLHTNSAAAAITRLLDMGIDDFLLTSTLHLIIGQRLVRRLCVGCRQPYKPSHEVLSRYEISLNPEQTWYKSNGCPKCQGVGYLGRTTILEALPMDESVRSAVLKREDALEIERRACAAGMRTLFRHGLSRVIAGETSLEEVLRVTSLN